MLRDPILILMLFPLLVAACGGGTTAPSPTVAVESGSAFEREILADGTVTAEEYERAVLRVLQCLDDHGVPHSDPEYIESEARPRWNYNVGPLTGEDIGRNVHEECFTAYLRQVLTQWSAQHDPSESDRQQLDEDLVRCLDDAGIEVSSRDEAMVLVRERQLNPEESGEFGRCMALVYRGIDLGNPAGQ